MRPTVAAPAPGPRAGFTLIELLVVVLILAILLTMTFTVVNNVLEGDRVRGAARQVQSYVAGARDRAIYAASRTPEGGTPTAVGVRFLPDEALGFISTSPPVPRAFSSMVFVQAPGALKVRLRVFEKTPGVWAVSQVNSGTTTPIDSGAIGWGRLVRRGLIGSPDGGTNYRARLMTDNGIPYTVNFDDDEPDDLTDEGDVMDASSGPGWLLEARLTKAFDLPAGAHDLVLTLEPAVLPGEEPRQLPRNSLIDVADSRAGGSGLATLLRGDGSFELMFNARGVVDGPNASRGSVHLVIADARDLETGFDLDLQRRTVGSETAERRGEEFVISVATQTGNIRIADVNPAPASPQPTDKTDPMQPDYDPRLDPSKPQYVGPAAQREFRADPFLFAETGGEAK